MSYPRMLLVRGARVTRYDERDRVVTLDVDEGFYRQLRAELARELIEQAAHLVSQREARLDCEHKHVRAGVCERCGLPQETGERG